MFNKSKYKSHIVESYYDDEDDMFDDDYDDDNSSYSSDFSLHRSGAGSFHNRNRSLSVENQKDKFPEFKNNEEKTEFFDRYLRHKLSINNDLDLRELEITSLYSVEKVRGNCDLSGTLIQDLSNLKYIYGDAYINNCKMLVSLSKLHTVMGNLYLLNDPALREAKFLSIVNGNLYLKNIAINNFFKFLNVDGKIYTTRDIANELVVSDELKSKIKIVR